MKVLVAGASGALGTPLVRRLVARGDEVLGITHSPANAQRLRAAGVRPVVVDALDREALLRAVDGLQADAVVHVLTALKKTPLRYSDLDLTNRLRTDGMANLAEAAQAVGARRFVTESFIKGYGFEDKGDRTLTEADPFAPAGQGKFEPVVGAVRSAENQTFDLAGIDGIALRFGYLYGPGAGIEEMVEMLRGHRFPIPRGGGGTNSFVYIEDAAAAIVAALDRGRPGAAYNVADDEPADWGEVLDEASRVFGVPRSLRVPGVLLRALPFAYAILSNSTRLSNARAKADLGWAPEAPTYREGLALSAEALGRRMGKAA